MSDVGDKAKAFRRMNVKISINLSESDLKTLKYLFEPEGLSVSDSEGATSGVRLFQLLEQRGVYTPHKVSVVKEALQTLGRVDLIEHILTFESDWRYEEHDGQGRQKQGPGVADCYRPDARDVRFVILTANTNEWESAKYFMGTPKDQYKITSELSKYLTEKSQIFSDSLKADKISKEIVEDSETYSYVKVCEVLGVLAKCSTIGSYKRGASKDTVSYLLETARDKHWELQAVFIVGCCGCAHDPEASEKVDLGTVLIADEIMRYTGKQIDEGSETNLETACTIDESWRRELKIPNGLSKLSKELKVQNLLYAPFVSSDFVIKNEVLAESLRKSKGSHFKVIGFEMEGVGAYDVISLMKDIPQDTSRPHPSKPAILVVKGVSDFANSKKNARAGTEFFNEYIPGPIVDKDSLPNADKDSLPNVDKDSLPNVDKDSLPNVDKDSLPNVDKDSLPNVDKDSLPNVDKDSLPNVDKDSLPNVDTDSLPNVDKDSLPNDKDSRQQICTMMSLMIVFRAIKAKWGDKRSS